MTLEYGLSSQSACFRTPLADPAQAVGPFLDRRTAAARRAAQVIVAIVAAFELRSLVTTAQRVRHVHLPATPALGSTTFWLTVLLSIGAGLLLREMVRGLTLPRLDRSRRPAVTWASCSVALLGVLYAAGLGGSGLSAGVPSILVALSVGLLLAASLRGTRWILRAVARLVPGAASRLRLCAAVTVAGWIDAVLAPAPLLAGWSDRGPPPSLA
jgi:hypothetical protein